MVGLLGWYRIPVGDARIGIPPGSSQDGFAVESTSVPGASQARCLGNAPFPSVTADTPDEVKKKIMEIERTDFLLVNVLAPVIPSAVNEPELPAGVFVARIQNSYGWPLTRSKHRRASEINERLARAVSGLQTDKPEQGVTEVKAVYPLLRDPGDDAWSKTLSDGLRLALEYAGRRYGW